MRSTVPTYLWLALATAACGGSDVLTGPGEPVELSHETLEGRWVLLSAVYTMLANPAVEERFESSPETGLILEFDGEGGVSYARVPAAADGDTVPSTYAIRGTRLRLDVEYQAEVTTTRLVLTLDDVRYDFGGDGRGEPAMHVKTYHKYKD